MPPPHAAWMAFLRTLDSRGRELCLRDASSPTSRKTAMMHLNASAGWLAADGMQGTVASMLYIDTPAFGFSRIIDIFGVRCGHYFRD